MDDKLIKKVLKQMPREIPAQGKCLEEADLCRFVEGLMDEGETAGVEKHLVACPTCCDYVVSLNKVMHFPEEEALPEVPGDQLKQASRACRVEEEKKETTQTRQRDGFLDKAIQFLKDIVSFEWLMQPMPLMVKAGAGAFLVILIFSTTFYYYQQSMSLNVDMQLIGKARVVTRGVPTGEFFEKIIKEGDALNSNDYCRIHFELDKDAYAYVLYYDSSGGIEQLYPDPAINIPQKVKGDTGYIIPAGQDKWFQLDDRKGTETVFVLAAREPIRDFNETIDTMQGLSKDGVLKTLKGKAPVVKVFSFDHQ